MSPLFFLCFFSCVCFVRDIHFQVSLLVKTGKSAGSLSYKMSEKKTGEKEKQKRLKRGNQTGKKTTKKKKEEKKKPLTRKKEKD